MKKQLKIANYCMKDEYARTLCMNQFD